jgi:histone-lysine N-methyltransferase SETMAR
MVHTSFKIRAFLLYDFKYQFSAAESAKRIRNVCGEDSVTDNTARFWFRRFKAGNEELEDEARQGRPSVFEDEELLRVVKSNPSAICKEIAEELCCDESTVRKRLHAVGFFKKWDKWVPHRMTEENKRMRLITCNSLLARNANDPFINRIVTCDEKWILYDNSRRSGKWVQRGQAPGMATKKDLHPKKVLVTVWWSVRGIVHVDYLRRGQTITADVYCKEIEEVHRKLLQTRAALVNRKGVLLLHDNARPHVAEITRAKLNELSWEVLPHPPYSPDISPCDYYLFLSMSNFLANKRFKTEDEVKNEVDRFFKSKNQDFYSRGIQLLVERWQKVVDCNGDYFIE